jgi:hypothetical protein
MSLNRLPHQSQTFRSAASTSGPSRGAAAFRNRSAVISLLRWPEQAEEIEACRRRKLPRLLLVAPHAEPPLSVDPLEDWVRAPVDDADLQARWHALTARAAPRKPVIDGQVLHFRGRRLLLAAGEADLVSVLLGAYRTVVSREDLAAQIWPHGGSERRNALDLRVLRTRRRLAPLGLAIKTVWRRGYLLDVATEGEAI